MQDSFKEHLRLDNNSQWPIYQNWNISITYQLILIANIPNESLECFRSFVNKLHTFHLYSLNVVPTMYACDLSQVSVTLTCRKTGSKCRGHV